MTNQPAAHVQGKEERDDLVRNLEPLVKPGKATEVVQMVQMTISRQHSGPLPSPEDFAGYEAAHPGTAERILSMAERAQAHRHKQEGRMVIGEFGLRLTGQIGAILSIVLLVVLVGYCAFVKQPLAASVVAAIGATAAYFLHRNREVDERSEDKPTPKPRRRKK